MDIMKLEMDKNMSNDRKDCYEFDPTRSMSPTLPVTLSSRSSSSSLTVSRSDGQDSKCSSHVSHFSSTKHVIMARKGL